MKPIYMQLFGFELMIEPTSYSALTYNNELTEVGMEREIQLGKVRVLISRVAKSSPRQFLLEQY